MRRIILSLGLVLGMVSASYSAIPVPTDKQNAQVIDPRWAGASVCDMSISSGTQDVLCATGKGVIFGVIVSSSAGASSLFVTLRDTATANHSSSVLSVHTAANSVASTLLTFPVSIKFVNGLNATMSAAPGSNEHWEILYRLQSDQN